MVRASTLAALVAFSFSSVHGLDLDVKSDIYCLDNCEYPGTFLQWQRGPGRCPGLLSEPYFWWNAGAMWDTLIQYWQLTGDDQYNGIVSQALQFQQGEDDRGDFMPLNQTKTLGNDDQSTWALAAMSAAEQNFPAPAGKSWVSLADAVFNEQAARWDAQTCGGGLRWQIFTFNNGYNYKNSISTGQFFQLAARLARYTGNTTYSDWASKAYSWTTTIGLLDSDYKVFDGTDVNQNCSSISKLQFSYAAGTYISGAAYMYNISTGDSQTTWKATLDGLLKTNLALFFPNGIATEVSCEKNGKCTLDMETMKGIFGQTLVDTIKVAPYTSENILKVIGSSAEAAAKACSDTECPLVWDGSDKRSGGVGGALSALSYVQGLLVGKAAAPAMVSNGGSGTNSTGAASGGSGTSTNSSTSGSLTSSGTPAPTTTTNAAVVLGSKMGGIVAIIGGMALLAL